MNTSKKLIIGSLIGAAATASANYLISEHQSTSATYPERQEARAKFVEAMYQLNIRTGNGDTITDERKEKAHQEGQKCLRANWECEEKISSKSDYAASIECSNESVRCYNDVIAKIDKVLAQK